jgi:hypothetical protein
MSTLEAVTSFETLTHLATGCDQCCARALVVAIGPNGLALYFCGHHAHANLDALNAQAFLVQTLDGAS